MNKDIIDENEKGKWVTTYPPISLREAMVGGEEE